MISVFRFRDKNGRADISSTSRWSISPSTVTCSESDESTDVEQAETVTTASPTETTIKKLEGSREGTTKQVSTTNAGLKLNVPVVDGTIMANNHCRKWALWIQRASLCVAVR